MKKRLAARRKHHNTKHGLHPALPVFVAFLGIVTVSLVFGMLLFPAFTGICVNQFLLAIANIGYFGVGLLFISLLLESYNLYEHHKKHVMLLVFMNILLATTTSVLIYMVANHYTC